MTSEQTITIEACTNDEWLASGICSDHAIDGCHQDDVAREYHGVACRALTDAGLDYDNPRGSRCLYHAWNGAHFTKRAGIFGTFGEPTAEELAIMESADAAGYKAACEFAAAIAASDAEFEREERLRRTAEVIADCRANDGR